MTLAERGAPRSILGWIVAGLAARKAAGIAPFAPMPCDNLANNSAKLNAALAASFVQRDTSPADGIAGEVQVPSTMVGSVTRASDAALYADIAAAPGIEVRGAAQRESFAQWFIEDIGRPIIPGLASVGATVTCDVLAMRKPSWRKLS